MTGARAVTGGGGTARGPAGGGPPAAWVAVPALLGLAAVLLAVGLGPVPLSGDSPADRIRPLEVAQPTADPAGERVVDVDPPRYGDAVAGVPLEVAAAVVATSLALALLVRSLLSARRDAPADSADGEDDGGGPPDEAVTADPDAAALAAAARSGLLRLADVPPGHLADVVVACWAELERAATGTGAARRWTDTPTEFAARLARSAPGLDRAALEGLRRTYSRVRFAAPGTPAREVTPAEADAARAALASLLRAVEVGA
ncbi:DUF4129 domain-containing protein [Aquipuribacter sp. SD81]|uniref:DUF4129 domain-containing protein n=1 Tax=Aquipuribacter sp. SD81 TaxID=3127703 RepID=UPI00301840C1